MGNHECKKQAYGRYEIKENRNPGLFAVIASHQGNNSDQKKEHVIAVVIEISAREKHGRRGAYCYRGNEPVDRSEGLWA